jgi:hypothetical protein
MSKKSAMTPASIIYSNLSIRIALSTHHHNSLTTITSGFNHELGTCKTKLSADGQIFQIFKLLFLGFS